MVNGPTPTPLHADSAVARRFPLVPRSRPACPPLPVRVGWVRDRALHPGGSPAESLRRSAEALNLAALILSDCGLPGHAAALCWRQATLYPAHRPFDLATAQLALQPVINLARLRIRAQEGDSAYRLLAALLACTTTGTDLTWDGNVLGLAGLVAEEHRAGLIQWLWSVLVSDGTRALAHAGRWPTVLEHLRRHHAVGRRLLDGRQIAIVAYHQTGAHDTARQLLAATEPRDPWETPVSTCLRVFCQPPSPGGEHDQVARMVEAYLLLPADPASPLFNAHLSLCVLDLLGEDTTHHQAAAGTVAVHAATRARSLGDAYAAQVLLDHPRCPAALPAPLEASLRRLADDAGLGHDTLPEDLLTELQDAVEISQATLGSALQKSTR